MAAARSLDLQEPQILAFYETDQIQWHHRLLLRRINSALWVWLTPDDEIQLGDLATVRIMSLARDAPFPPQTAGNIYAFADAPSETALRAHHATAARMASVLGAAPLASADALQLQAQWRVSDPGRADFAEPVPEDLMSNPNTGIFRDSVGLARVTLSDGQSQWITVERVLEKDPDTWEADRRSGEGRDRRIGGDRRDMAGRRHTNLADALNTYRPMDLTKVMDWLHAGPRAILEILSGIRGAGRELATYRDLWMSANGFHPDHNIAWERKTLLLVLHHLVTYTTRST